MKQERDNKTSGQQFVLPVFEVVRTHVSAEDQRTLGGGEIDESQRFLSNGKPRKKLPEAEAFTRETLIGKRV